MSFSTRITHTEFATHCNVFTLQHITMCCKLCVRVRKHMRVRKIPVILMLRPRKLMLQSPILRLLILRPPPQITTSNTASDTLQHTATHCNTLQRTATHCNTLQHTATHCNNTSTDSPTYDLKYRFGESVFVVLQCVAVCCSVSVDTDTEVGASIFGESVEVGESMCVNEFMCLY